MKNRATTLLCRGKSPARPARVLASAVKAAVLAAFCAFGADGAARLRDSRTPPDGQGAVGSPPYGQVVRTVASHEVLGARDAVARWDDIHPHAGRGRRDVSEVVRTASFCGLPLATRAAQ